MTNHLLEAVQRLTQPQTTKIPQANAAGIQCISEVTHDPLLLQLRDAVAGGTGKHAGSSPARERMPIDAGALELFDDITKQINTWYLDTVQHIQHLHITDRLDAVYRAHENARRAGNITDETDRAMTSIIRTWANTIQGMFDPPRRLELTVSRWEPERDRKGNIIWVDGKMQRKILETHMAKCPLCDAAYWVNPETGDQSPALILEYRELGQDTIDKAQALCRACENVWTGGHGVRELSWEIEQQEAALNATEQTA